VHRPPQPPPRTMHPGPARNHSGAGCDSASSREAVATIAPASFTSTAFTPDVPMSIPRCTPSSVSGCAAVSELRRLFRNRPLLALTAAGRRHGRKGFALPAKQLWPHLGASWPLFKTSEHVGLCKPRQVLSITTESRPDDRASSNQIPRHARVRACMHLSRQRHSILRLTSVCCRIRSEPGCAYQEPKHYRSSRRRRYSRARQD